MASPATSVHDSVVLEGVALGHLKVMERVRSGVAGAVYLAIDEAAGRSLAVEILVSAPVQSDRRRRALADEARRASALAHPSIVPVLAAGEVGRCVYVAVEPLRGASLRELAARGPLPASEALRIGEGLARALAAAHAAGLAHRHLASSRVIVAPDGRVLLLGFGLGAWGEDGAPTASETRLAAESAGAEPPEHAAPEQVRGLAGDARADVFAFGALLRELLAGGVAPGIAGVIARCLEPDPSARFADARALLDALGPLGGEPAAPPPEPAPIEPVAAEAPARRPPATSSRAPGVLAVRLASDAESGEAAEPIELLSLAGSGGMGEVWRARFAASGKPVAVKLLLGEGGDARRFAREAAVLSSFQHPGVVRYEAHGVAADGTPFLAMEWLDGEDLDEALARGPLSVRDTTALARRVAEALAAAHLRGVVHRDLKPANLFLVDGRAEAPKLLDFGLARPVADSGLTVPGTVLGTPAYMAPEQIRGEPVDARADVYGLGAVMFRCLAGRPPFGGEHRIAVLAKVLVEEPPPLSLFAPGVPPGLDALVRRMLAKDPDHRPPDGAAVVQAIAEIDAFEPVSRTSSGIGAHELRVACVVLCAAPSAFDVTLPASDSGSRGDVRVAVEERGGVLEALTRGTWMVTVRGAASPSEQAARALRCALALAAARPGAPVVVATGRVVAAGDVQVGEVIDRAAAALLEPRDGQAGGVRIDEATAALLDDRFQVSGSGPWRRVLGEQSSVAPVRTLLGKPASCVGRTQELSALSAAMQECAEEPRARAVLVTAAPGLGKSRVVQEFLGTVAAVRGAVDVLFARGDAVRSLSPFGIASQMLRGAAHILDSDMAPERARKLAASLEGRFGDADRRRLEEFLGEICGAPVPHDEASPALRAARADAAVMGDALREAWVDWLRVRAEDTCTMLVIEDLHWADLPSVRLLDAALDALWDRPVMVLATARPEVHTRFPDLWSKRGLQQLSLAPLTKRAAQRLVREALGARAGAAVEDAIVERAAGHPFHLEELVRAVASGQGPGALPDSVLGMIQARLDVLDPVARRTLRAASVFGETFWSGGVRAVMGGDVAAERVASHLGRLAEEEIVTRRSASRLLGETEYTFRHALVRDAAYATLTEHDRGLAHRLAGGWLEAVGESDPALLADHYERGGAPAEALRFFRRAAEQAFEGNDLERATSFADRALACGPDEATEGAIWAMQAEVAYWKGSLDEAAERAARAVDRLAEGSAEWFGAVSVAIGASGQRGRNDDVAGWVDRAARSGAIGEAGGACAVTLCRGLTQLYWAHHRGSLGAARARLDELTRLPEALDPYQSGWVHRVRAESAWLHEKDLDGCRAAFAASCDAFELARAQRNLCLAQMNWASLAGWSGETDRGLDLVERARREAARIGAGFLVLYGVPVRGLLEAYAGMPEAASTMRRALANLGGSPRLAFIARVVLGWLALDAGDLREANEHAAAAISLPVVPDLRPAGLALRSRVLVAEGRLDEGLADALEAALLAAERDDLELTVGMSELALAEVHEARGDRTAARDVLTAGYRRLAGIAATIAAPEGRRRFWARRLPNDRIERLAIAWGIAVG